MIIFALVLFSLNLVLILVALQVLTYQGEEMEEDEETMADYDIQVKTNFTMLTVFNS